MYLDHPLTVFMHGVALYEQANRLRDLGEYDMAFALYQKAPTLLGDRLDVPFYYDLALAQDLRGNGVAASQSFDQCIDAFKKMQSGDPHDARLENLAPLANDCEHQLYLKSKCSTTDSDYLSCVKVSTWQKQDHVLSVYIAKSPVDGFAAATVELINGAVQQWANHIDFHIRHAERADADIIIERAQPHADVARAGGQTTYVYADLENTKLKQVCVSLFSAQYNHDHSYPPKFYSLVLHELGHAFGLDGHSPFGTDLMYFKSNRLELSERDIATLKCIYGLAT